MLYFSYGSFMGSEVLKRHSPGAKFISKAILPNWELQFNFMSKTYGGGVTGIEPAVGKLVCGVLYEVPDDEMTRLDKVEGVPEGIYYRQTIFVVDEDGRPSRRRPIERPIPAGRSSQQKDTSK